MKNNPAEKQVENQELKNWFKEMDVEFEREIKRDKECAQIIWDSPFHTGLPKLKKEDLLRLISKLVAELNLLKDPEQDQYWKDICWSEKCLLIELLDSEFFNRESEVSNDK